MIGRILIQLLCLFFDYFLYFLFVIIFLYACSRKVSLSPQLLHNLFNAGHLCDGFPVGALQNLHGLSFVILFVPNLFIFCIGSSLVSFSRFVTRASIILFFRFFVSYVFCLINSIVFISSSSSSFINLLLSFVSVIVVMNFETSRSSAVIPSNAHSFSISINLRQKSSGASVALSCPDDFSAIVIVFLFGRKN